MSTKKKSVLKTERQINKAIAVFITVLSAYLIIFALHILPDAYLLIEGLVLVVLAYGTIFLTLISLTVNE